MTILKKMDLTENTVLLRTPPPESLPQNIRRSSAPICCWHEVPAYDSDQLPADPKPNDLTRRSKAVFHRQEPPVHKEQGRGGSSISKRMHLFLFLLVCTCTGSLYAQDLNGIVVHAYVSQGFLFSSRNNYLSMKSVLSVPNQFQISGSMRCGSQDLTLQAILSNGVATVRQTLRRMFSAMVAERAKKRRKLVLTPGFVNHDSL